ncbi:HET-domain-containing protein [Lophiostoma macrostomum CBS 122681]|uniref:HET-domain-containing protein n=1 Tax=Lophiostoma macrostomum CBS 122681 TaxID=1314788 RepID=A0A6A6TBT4_9PLEO|nr:HET-domain-containing protein [Lophiostoma macrostomum CBS 122681]
MVASFGSSRSLIASIRHVKLRDVRQFRTHVSLKYKYRPLATNEIRLINLHPGHQSDPLQCSVQHAILEDKLQYESLSYCWGTNVPEADVKCDGGPIGVTKNLHSALQRLRQCESTRRLWIDAICIDQTNVEERGWQVALMKDIFQSSDRTVVWLGEAAHDSDSGIRLIQELARISQEHGAPSWSRALATSIPPLYDPAWNAFAQILQRPWFHRAWIVQEASVSRDLHLLCGEESITWDVLVRAVQYAVDLGVFVAYGGSTTFQALRLFETRSNYQAKKLPLLHDVLLLNRSFEATDPRDKLFGLLSLADQEDVQAMDVHPDYSLDVEQLYEGFTRRLLQKLDLRAFSASCVRETGGTRTLPTWVSDWSISDPAEPLSSVQSSVYGDRSSFASPSAVKFQASGSTVSDPIFNSKENLLGLEGILVDQIETVGTLCRTRYLRHVSHMFQLFVQCRDILQQLRDWEYVAHARSTGRYLTGEKHRDAYWQTLCAGRLPEGVSHAHKDPRFKYYMVIRSLSAFVKLTIRWFPRSHKDTWYNRMFYYIMFQSAWRLLGLSPAKIQRIGFPPESRLSNHRRMVRTQKGYIALAPRFAKPGDWIGVFKGGKWPLIIRKDGDYWVLIGESYVHGIMNGEAWENTSAQLMWFR